MSCCSGLSLGPHEMLAFWCFPLLLFEIISKSDLPHAYQIFEIINSMKTFRSCMINRNFNNVFELRFTRGGLLLI